MKERNEKNGHELRRTLEDFVNVLGGPLLVAVIVYRDEKSGSVVAGHEWLRFLDENPERFQTVTIDVSHVDLEGNDQATSILRNAYVVINAIPDHVFLDDRQSSWMVAWASNRSLAEGLMVRCYEPQADWRGGVLRKFSRLLAGLGNLTLLEYALNSGESGNGDLVPSSDDGANESVKQYLELIEKSREPTRPIRPIR